MEASEHHVEGVEGVFAAAVGSCTRGWRPLREGRARVLGFFLPTNLGEIQKKTPMISLVGANSVYVMCLKEISLWPMDVYIILDMNVIVIVRCSHSLLNF